MLFKEALLLIVFAGLINGCWAVPLRLMKHAGYEASWFCFAIVAYMIVPWALLLWMMPTALMHYATIPIAMWGVIVVASLAYGVGQALFFYAMQLAGMSISFVINLGIGVVIGSLFIVIYRGLLFSQQGLFVCLSVLLILTSLWMYYFMSRHKAEVDAKVLHAHHVGWLLASMTGVASGLQNISFVVVSFHEQAIFHSHNAYWFWPPFFSIASIPLLLSFAWRSRLSWRHYHQLLSGFLGLRNSSLLLLSGLCFAGSLAIYSISMSHFTASQQIVGWPALLLSIIFSSQLWGWVYKESDHLSLSKRLGMLLSLVLLVAAIILLSLEM